MPDKTQAQNERYIKIMRKCLTHLETADTVRGIIDSGVLPMYSPNLRILYAYAAGFADGKRQERSGKLLTGAKSGKAKQ